MTENYIKEKSKKKKIFDRWTLKAVVGLLLVRLFFYSLQNYYVPKATDTNLFFIEPITRYF